MSDSTILTGFLSYSKAEDLWFISGQYVPSYLLLRCFSCRLYKGRMHSGALRGLTGHEHRVTMNSAGEAVAIECLLDYKKEGFLKDG